jgi:threonine synthase
LYNEDNDIKDQEELRMTLIACTDCGKPYPDRTNPFICECGGVYDFIEFPAFDQAGINANATDLWRYDKLLGLSHNIERVTLGEGGTPLIQVNQGTRLLWLKLESENPTGSYKDRGSSVLVSHLKNRGVDYAVEDSSGNAGASFAAYCARGNLKCRVFVPESASGPKRSQIEMFGADLMKIPGPRSEAAMAVLEEAKRGIVYGSHAFMPFGLPGIATIAYELVEQLGKVPSSVIAPVGHGGLLYGIMLGFEAMLKSGVIEKEPYYIGVQSEGCAPIAVAYQREKEAPVGITPGETLAEGVKVTSPIRGKAILSRLINGKGEMMAISEKDISDAYIELARIGVYCEPTSALVWAAAKKVTQTRLTPTVAIITGSGYKSNLILNME